MKCSLKRSAVVASLLTMLFGCTLINPTAKFVDAETDADATPDADGAPDVSLDAARPDSDAEADADATPDADAAPTCTPDPLLEGDGLCRTDADCLPHCSENWDVGCFFGAFGRPRTEGTCVYRDCRLADITISFPMQCPVASDCPPMFCGRRFGSLSCVPTPPANGSCNYGAPVD